MSNDDQIQVQDPDVIVDKTKGREPEDVTGAVADEIVAQVIDLQGRRAIPLPSGDTLYIRNPNQGDEEAAEAAYAKSLFSLNKIDGLPYIAQVARDILKMVDDPDVFGYRERSIVNEEEIRSAEETNKKALNSWETENKGKAKKSTKPDLVNIPEAYVDEGSDSIKSIFSDKAIGPFEKTQALMHCISGTEFANLVLQCAEYRSGKARTRRLLLACVEKGFKHNDEIKFSKYWNGKEEMDSDDPVIVGYLEMAFQAMQSEVLSQDFLQRLLSAAAVGQPKN